MTFDVLTEIKSETQIKARSHGNILSTRSRKKQKFVEAVNDEFSSNKIGTSTSMYKKE